MSHDFHALADVQNGRIDRRIYTDPAIYDQEVAAFAAMRELGDCTAQLDYYRIIPEWITGMAIVTARDRAGLQ